MAPRGAPLFSSGVVFCAFLRLVVCQLEAMDARDHFRMDHDKHDHTDVSSSSKSSDPDFTAAPLATTSGTTTSNGTPRSTALPLGFGSDCSHDGQCNALLGLACISIANNASKCGCASSTPIYVNEGGVHKCVRAKNLNEACVSNQECNYGNPNVQCVNNFCNCSHPFELTATRLCLLPSNQGGNMFTMALSVMLVLALLLLAAGYVYQNSSSSGITSSSRRSRRKRKRSSDATTTTSTTCILAKDRSSSDGANEPEYSAGDNDSSEVQEEDLRRQPRGPPWRLVHAGLFDAASPPASFHQAAGLSRVTRARVCRLCKRPIVLPPGGEEPQEELNLSGSSAGDQPKEDPRAAQWRRTRKGQRLPSLDGRKTGGELVYNKPGSSSPPMHMLGPKDEQMQRVFDKQQVVVTIETHKPRPLGTSPSPPPVVSLLRRELPPSESTDDSFMKDLKRRRSLKARFSDDFCGTMSRRCSVSAEPLRVAAVAVQCDAAQDTPAEAAPVATVAKEAPKVAEPQATGVTFGTSVPVHGFTASTKPVKKQTGDIEHGEQAPAEGNRRSSY
ncbi:hypothetical protein MTO96_017188 [Rhipicephalus appendiculatus]